MRRMKIRRIREGRGGGTWDRVRGRAGPCLFSATTARFCEADTKLLIFTCTLPCKGQVCMPRAAINLVTSRLEYSSMWNYM